jgi:hypothetical protein
MTIVALTNPLGIELVGDVVGLEAIVLLLELGVRGSYCRPI